MSRSCEFYIVDIFIASHKIKRYTKHFKDAKSFLHSELEWDAVIRELEIIGEATKHLLNEGFMDPKHKVIVDFRNQIAHGYFGIDEHIVWEVVQALLDNFIQELIIIVRQNRLDLSSAIKNAKKDYHFSKKTVAYLNSLCASFNC